MLNNVINSTEMLYIYIQRERDRDRDRDRERERDSIYVERERETETETKKQRSKKNGETAQTNEMEKKCGLTFTLDLGVKTWRRVFLRPFIKN